jgi:hypothetical protein
MPNMVAPGETEDIEVACVILCCDRKQYDMKRKFQSKKKGANSCMRLGSKKHGCVDRNLRGKKGIAPEKRFRKRDIRKIADPTKRQKILNFMRREGKKSIRPDVMLSNQRIAIDAKFPCKTDELNDSMKNSKVVRKSWPGRGADMADEKEEIYGMLPGVRRCVPMSPDDAEEKVTKAGANCDCKQVK